MCMYYNFVSLRKTQIFIEFCQVSSVSDNRMQKQKIESIKLKTQSVLLTS